MFSYSLHQNDQWARVTAVGEVDLDHSERFRLALENLAASGTPLVEVELSGVRFINSEGIGLLVALRKKVDGRGGELRVLYPNETVETLLRQCGLERFLNVTRFVCRDLDETLCPA